MNKEEIQEYTRRISQGSRSDLVVTTYDIILSYLKHSIDAYDEGDESAYTWNIRKAQEFLTELVRSLDLSYEVSQNLFQIYMFIQKTLREINFNKSVSDLERCKKMLENLKEAFEAIAKTDKSGPVMANVERVYAGLTYGKGTLNELYEGKSGFRV